MYRIELEKGNVTETTSPNPPAAYTMMKRANHYICAATQDGSIHLLDSKSLKLVNSWKAYAGSVNDMDARGEYLLTCGWTQQQYQGMALERLVRVYDLKNQRSVAPVTFGQGAAFVRMHPKLSSTCIVLSAMGAIQSIDVQNPDVPMMRFAQVYDAHITGLELMPAGKGFAMTDSQGHITLWGAAAKMQFMEYALPLDFPDDQSPVRALEWSNDLPLNMVGMPYYRELLMSAWPSHMAHEALSVSSAIDPATMTSSRKFEHGSVGANIRKARRYQIEDSKGSSQDPSGLPAPKFLSEQRKDEDGNYEVERRLSEDIGKTLSSLTLNGGLPVYYHPQKMAYSKFGVDDFDFRYFNQTQYSGLEIHIVNSYANALLQVIRFTTVVRNLALRHTARDCRFESCMLCETGFVVDMLEKAQGHICQATNFFKALSKYPNTAGLAFLEESTINTPLTAMIQNLNRFLMPTLDNDYRRIGGNAAESAAALGTIGRSHSVCTACSYEDSKDQIWYTHNLVYAPKNTKHSPRSMRQYFSRVLKESIERYDQHKGWCTRCQGYKVIRSRRTLLTPPSVLMIHTAVHTAGARQLWATPGFLPREIGVIVNHDQFYCYEGQDLQLHLQRRIYDITVYELVGLVADVTASEGQQPHLVSLINTGVLGQGSGPRPPSWHLFNDFMVRMVPAQEALHFDPRWKLPSVITYQASRTIGHLDQSWKTQIDSTVLYRSVSQPASSPQYRFRPLESIEQLSGKQAHYAIDAEFVRLLREEIDMDANGKRAITRPARSGLARVSVLRGDGPDEELPFVDDYIAIDEPVDDYLTQYSGLEPGDLTVGTSRFALVGLKEVYKKLWVLLNLGCIFIGHGLSSDFRTINIHVPEAQVIDTQDLYSLGDRTRRKLSLRFLAWLLLGEDIQQNVTAIGHDSIEDARTALKLWRKYLEFEREGQVEKIKDEIYVKGKATDYKVPTARNGMALAGFPAAGSTPGTPERRFASVAGVGSSSPLR